MTDKTLACFQKFDFDGDGKISRQELGAALKKLKPSVFSDESNVDALLQKVDKNRDGFIDYEEFVAWTQDETDLPLKALHADDLTSTHKDPPGYLFSLIDRNDDGVIDENEWEKWFEVLATLSEELGESEHLDFETVRGFTGNPDAEEDEVEDEDEEGVLDRGKWSNWMLSLHKVAGEDIAELIFEKGTLAGKVVLLQAQYPEAPQAAILEALNKKKGSTTSAGQWLSHCEKKGKWDAYDEEEEEEEDED
uniref:EF-hand domain-containing protein n=1 Tax=Pyrodinium bahamense TaxID=73915 RepID=A0A7R9ZZV5_9DINO|mmetsp:Transcript_16360/g.45071  ORF Transcript_16360/g.45071 Transcript_16360/m.45071 type:complete len:250 (+) Transcript_16360:87-836(+)|eukprot:CAMPEP_0179072688 /NCGR_PEP_ID=MMETSP0796-20121207/32185_1 /TAXON_ID=73915 /ORGANISM="Pyrodinium bahamense, Strain pbaha01" /LENGTH=249 /DNA_ID=CAMNT_0020769859 /DNA_START=21 /DNA_END=770 /DNA_ORIENTATION=+